MFRACMSGLIVMAAAASSHATEGVILLHGLCRTDRSMMRLAAAFESDGYVVLNVDHPSRTATVEELATHTISRALDDPKLREVNKVHFIAHSMGAILVRQYFAGRSHDRLGRV